MIKKLLTKKSLNILGINSGTSADGLDLAAINFSRQSGRIKIKFLTGASFPYSVAMKRELEKTMAEKYLSPEILSRIDMTYGFYLGHVIAGFMRRERLKVDLVASHGQTIRHYPRAKRSLGRKSKATIQVGDGNAVSQVVGIPVINDFRKADIAAGGEGAPLTPFVNQILFGSRKTARVIVNLGGIANFSYHPAGGDAGAVRGGDCGPGNRLSDLACQLIFHKRFDKDGKLAGKGRVIKEVVRTAVTVSQKRTISTGREQFDELLLARLIHLLRRQKGNYNDLLASINDATAGLVHNALRKYLDDPDLDSVYLTGGGRKNIFLVRQLAGRMKPLTVLPVEALGYDGDLLEAISFAVLGGCFLRGVPSTIPEVTGARCAGIAGKLSLPAV